MNRKYKIIALLFGGLLLAGGGFVAGLFFAAQHVPNFYRQALDELPERQIAANDQLLENATALASNARRAGRWSALFTSEQINGWLAVDLPQNYPDLLPEGITDPRVRIAPGKLTIACRYKQGGLEPVVSLNVELYVPEPNVLALRIHNVRAGAIPIPLKQVLEGVSAAARDMNIHLRWAQAQGDPVALVPIPKVFGKNENVYRLETIDLRNDAIYLAGHTDQPGSSGAKQPVVAAQASSSDKTQR